MVDESSQVPLSGGINDVIMVHPEQIAATNASCLVSLFPLVRYGLSYHLTYVLNDHLVSCYTLHRKETPIVNGGLGKLELLLPCLHEESHVLGYYNSTELYQSTPMERSSREILNALK